MKKTTKLLALLLALCMMVSVLAACASKDDDGGSADPGTSAGDNTSSTPDTDKNGDAQPSGDETPDADRDTTLTVGVTSANNTHDPLALNSAMYQTDSLFEALFRMNVDTQEVEPWLAESYEFLDDLTLQIRLRQDVYFTDGQLMTADDVLCSYRDVGAVMSATYYSCYDFDNFEILDDFTINFKFYEKYSPALAWMSNTAIYCADDILNGASDADKWMSAPNGTGPYYCVENVAASHVTYARKSADQYWGELPACTQVTFKYYSETTTMFIDFESGNLDVANLISTVDAERVLAGDCPDFTGYVVKPYNDVLLIVLPEETATFDDVRVREAFFKSVDAGSAAMAVYGSLYMKADSILPSTLTKYYESQPQVEYDPDGAKALLAEAGYPDGVPLRLIVTADLKEMAEALQGSLTVGGFNVSVESYDFGTAIPMLRNMESDFVVTQTVDGAFAYEPSQAIPITWGPNSTYQPVGMDAPEWAENFGRALTTDGDERVEAYHKLQEWAASEYRFLPVCERVGVTIYNTDKLASFTLRVANRPVAQCAEFK